MAVAAQDLGDLVAHPAVLARDPLHQAGQFLGLVAMMMAPKTYDPIRQPKAQVTVSSLPDETQVVVLEARGRTG